MSIRERVIAVIFAAAVLPGPALGAGVAMCPHDGGQSEACCMPDSALQGDGCPCCAHNPQPPSDRDRLDEGCGCAHAPQAPADLVCAKTPTDPETGAVDGPATEKVSNDARTARFVRATARAAPLVGAQALFLLDCAFLT